jgi:hypothetical protein
LVEGTLSLSETPLCARSQAANYSRASAIFLIELCYQRAIGEGGQVPPEQYKHSRADQCAFICVSPSSDVHVRDGPQCASSPRLGTPCARVLSVALGSGLWLTSFRPAFRICVLSRRLTTRAKPRRRRVFPSAAPPLVCATERFVKVFWKQKGIIRRLCVTFSCFE